MPALKGKRVKEGIRIGTQLILSDTEFIYLQEQTSGRDPISICTLLRELLIVWIQGGLEIPRYRLLRKQRADASTKRVVNGKIAREWQSDKPPEPVPVVPMRKRKGRPALNDTEFVRAIVRKELEQIFGKLP